MRRIRTVVATEILIVLGLVGCAGIAYLIERAYRLDHAVRLSPVAAAAVAAAPAALWLVAFALMDRRSTAPKRYVVGIYLLGALVAGPIADFVVSQAIAEPMAPLPQLGRFSTAGILRAILVVGIAQELCKYAVVRYTVYLSPELAEPLDGIIYMTAVGLGFATYDNYDQLSQLGNSVYVSVGAQMIVSTTLMHACVAAVVGYALGKAKFVHTSSYERSKALLGGLCAAMVLNGQFRVVNGVVSTTGVEVQAWKGIAYAGGFAAAMFLVTSVLMRRYLTEADE